MAKKKQQQPLSRVTYQAIKRKELKKVTRLKTSVFWVLLGLCLTLLISCGYQLWHWSNDNKGIKKIISDLAKEVKQTEVLETGDLVNPPDEKDNDYWQYIKVPFLEVDFTNLQKKNLDTVAFIHMENSNINYPVVQAKDNDYYLTHAFDKSKNDAGWVYMDYRNNSQELADNTIIYGHGRLDTTVFGSLKNVLTKKWQTNKNNYSIRLSTPFVNYVFQIFSIYTIQEESYYIQTSFKTTASKEKWLTTMKERNQAPIDTAVNNNDKILTLSTCQNNQGGRIVVHAKLIKQQIRN